MPKYKSFFQGFVRLQEIINTWPYKADQILYRKLYPDGDNLETFKHIFKVAHMSYHVLDCDVDNILKYMYEIVQVDNSTQYQVGKIFIPSKTPASVLIVICHARPQR